MAIRMTCYILLLSILFIASCAKKKPAPLLTAPIPGLSAEEAAYAFAFEQMEKVKEIAPITEVKPDAGMETLSWQRFPLLGGPEGRLEGVGARIVGERGAILLGASFYKADVKRPRWDWVSLFLRELDVEQLETSPKMEPPYSAEMEFVLSQAEALVKLKDAETLIAQTEETLLSRNLMYNVKDLTTIIFKSEGGKEPVYVYVDMREQKNGWAVTGWQLAE